MSSTCPTAPSVASTGTGLGATTHDSAAGPSEDRLDVVDVLAHEVAEVEAGDVAGAAGPREGEQLFDDQQQPCALLQRGFGLFPNLGRVVARELLDAELQPGERGTELVARVLTRSCVRRAGAPRRGPRCDRGTRRSRRSRALRCAGSRARSRRRRAGSRNGRDGRAGRPAAGSGSVRGRAPRRVPPLPSTTSASRACRTRASIVSEGDSTRTLVPAGPMTFAVIGSCTGVGFDATWRLYGQPRAQPAVRWQNTTTRSPAGT